MEKRKIIYVVGYGRMGTTILSEYLCSKVGGMNLGELKYVFNDAKDDLLSDYWLNVKSKISPACRKKMRRMDSVLGLFFWDVKLYSKIHSEIFSGLDSAVFIDSSKTTLDTILRPYNLARAGYTVSCVKNDIAIKSVIKSLFFKGKNSKIERFGHDGRRLLTFVPSILHCLVTELLVGFYKPYVYRMTDIMDYLSSNKIDQLNNNSVYGNRGRTR